MWSSFEKLCPYPLRYLKKRIKILNLFGYVACGSREEGDKSVEHIGVSPEDSQFSLWDPQHLNSYTQKRIITQQGDSSFSIKYT